MGGWQLLRDGHGKKSVIISNFFKERVQILKKV